MVKNVDYLEEASMEVENLSQKKNRVSNIQITEENMLDEVGEGIGD